MALFFFGKELEPKAFVERSLGPQKVNSAVRSYPKVARRDPPAGAITARNLDPLAKIHARDVGRPGIKQAAKVVVPLLSGELFLEGAPFGVGFGDVAHAAKVNRAIAERNVRVTNPDRFTF